MNSSPHNCILCFIIAASLALLAACDRNPGKAKAGQLPDALPPDQAAMQIESTFSANPDEWVKTTVQSAIKALRDKKYDAAYAALQMLKVSGKIGEAEDMAVRNAIIGVSMAAARAAERGDAQAAEMMKNIR
ncbi:MAG: hypothetical protein FJ404_18380 [Verrucomicrobia bacterium]|nr:hypothetical protein [Verrucomicrobiota bacterium]